MVKLIVGLIVLWLWSGLFFHLGMEYKAVEYRKLFHEADIAEAWGPGDLHRLIPIGRPLPQPGLLMKCYNLDEQGRIIE